MNSWNTEVKNHVLSFQKPTRKAVDSMSIRFDSIGCVAQLKFELIIVMKDLQQELLLTAKQGMLTPEGEWDLNAEEIVVIANVIVASIVGGPWSVLDEFGSGSAMDLFNPALPKYKNSNMWNPARGNDTTIRSRPDKPGQIDIFGHPVNGKGAGGVDLEAVGIVDAQIPSHAIETAMRWMKVGRMQQVIQGVVNRFPFGKFIVCDTK